MKILLLILSLLALSIIVMLFFLGSHSKQGKALGILDGRLSPCLDKPNCVCSEYVQDPEHYTSPFPVGQRSRSEAALILKNIIQTMGGVLQNKTDSYIAATFSSSIFGFIDDLEIRIDSNNKLIHIRSASRVGHSDLGINQKRVELVKQLYKENLGE
ncbi:MAG: DUF1499 domain-containing protein [Methylophaga sp.]|nr:DUF1499 domain-containing protein [Methylophaga sp.]